MSRLVTVVAVIVLFLGMTAVMATPVGDPVHVCAKSVGTGSCAWWTARNRSAARQNRDRSAHRRTADMKPNHTAQRRTAGLVVSLLEAAGVVEIYSKRSTATLRFDRSVWGPAGV